MSQSQESDGKGFIGYRGKGGKTGMRLGIEYYRGHDLQTQFKGDREHYLALSFSGEF